MLAQYPETENLKGAKTYVLGEKCTIAENSAIIL